MPRVPLGAPHLRSPWRGPAAFQALQPPVGTRGLSEPPLVPMTILVVSTDADERLCPEDCGGVLESVPDCEHNDCQDLDGPVADDCHHCRSYP
jgi:hypothetical protein